MVSSSPEARVGCGLALPAFCLWTTCQICEYELRERGAFEPAVVARRNSHAAKGPLRLALNRPLALPKGGFGHLSVYHRQS